MENAAPQTAIETRLAGEIRSVERVSRGRTDQEEPEELRAIGEVIGVESGYGRERIADPGDQVPGGGRGVGAGGLQGSGQEARDPVGGGAVALEEVAPLGHQRHAGR